MFDKTIIRKELQNLTDEHPNYDKFDFDLIIDSYQVIDGFFVFRVEDCAFFFSDNVLMDSCPGYFCEVEI